MEADMINTENSTEIEELVCETVLKYDSNDPEEIVRAKDIEILEIPVTSKKESMSFQYDKNNVILIDFNLRPERFQYKLAHELGHILIHGNDCNHQYSHRHRREKHKILDYEADYFAEKLLNYQADGA